MGVCILYMHLYILIPVIKPFPGCFCNLQDKVNVLVFKSLEPCLPLSGRSKRFQVLKSKGRKIKMDDSMVKDKQHFHF